MPVFPYATSAWERDPRPHKLAQLSLPFKPSLAQLSIKNKLTTLNAADRSREEDAQKAEREAVILHEVTKFMAGLKEVEAKHSEEIRQAREELQTALKKHQDDEAAWQKYVAVRLCKAWTNIAQKRAKVSGRTSR